jgi:hypothetical protein
LKILRIILLSLIGIVLTTPGVAYAAPIASPTTYDINAVDVYSPALETGDQLFIVKFEITYGVNPTEDAGEAWLLRLKDSTGAEVASASPYAYYNSGYIAGGGVSFYLPASIAIAWGSAATVVIEPNPTLTWTSMPAPKSFAALAWNSATTIGTVATAVGARVRVLAIGLNSLASLDFAENINGVWKFTSYGEGYFDVVIPILRTVQPNLYQSTLRSPILADNQYGDTYQQNTDANLVGTPLDPTNLAAGMGLSRMWATGAIWFGFCILVAGLIGYKAQSAKPTFFLFGALMIAGSFMGFGMLQGILFGLAGGGSLVLAFAWRGA